MSDHILQAFRLILTAAEAYVRQACHFVHPIHIIFSPKGDLQVKREKRARAHIFLFSLTEKKL